MRLKFGFVIFPQSEASGYIIHDIVWARSWDEAWNKIEKRYPNKNVLHNHLVSQKVVIGYRNESLHAQKHSAL